MRVFTTNQVCRILLDRARARGTGAAGARWLLGAGIGLASAGAGAAGLSLGVGAGLDRGRVDCVATFPCDRSASHAKVFVGYQLGDTWEVQAVYFDAGRFQGGGTTPLGTEFGGGFKVDGFGVTAGYRWTFAPGWSLAGRGGLASVRTRFDYAGPFSGGANQTHTRPLLGLGIGYAITPNWRLGLDYDLTRFKVHTTYGPLQMLGLSAQFSF